MKQDLEEEEESNLGSEFHVHVLRWICSSVFFLGWVAKLKVLNILLEEW